ncbi:MAG: toll/interleukin-1 receptor domain-containing protein [Lachnospiraceae bacterium]|nr:toll/interleukin-1 receptor domain-containing protein [Lachnospiraceae bacterium]
MKKYDVFIGYRRETGAETAKHLRDVLKARGYRVFFDTDTLSAGNFDEELLRTVKECDDYIIVLSLGTLDRCWDEGDWIRRELECALKTGKNIVPIMFDDFAFPEKLPEEINEIRWKSGIQVNVQYFDAAVNRLITFLTKKPWDVVIKRRILPGVLAVLLVVLAGMQIKQHVKTVFFSDFPITSEDRDTLDACIGYVSINMSYANLAFNHYDKVLADAAAYCDGKAGAPNQEELLFEIEYYKEKLNGAKELVSDMDEGLSGKIAGIDELDSAEFNGMATEIRRGIAEMMDYMDTMYWMFSESGHTDAMNAKIINVLQNLSAETEEYYYLCLNEMFADVDKDAMQELIGEHLPLMTSIYQPGYVWSTDKAALESYEDTLWTKMQASVNEYASLVGGWGQEVDKLQRELLDGDDVE